MDRLAYLVPSEWDEEFKEIRFMGEAEASQLADDIGEPIDRAKEYDEFALQGFVPAQRLLDDGWWFECWHCQTHVCGDEGNPVASGHGVWCSSDCHAAWSVRKKEIATRKLELDAWLASLGMEIKVNYSSNGGTICECFNGDRENVFAKFSFPGSSTNNNSACLGCKKIWICHGDRDAWDQLKASKKQVNAQ